MALAAVPAALAAVPAALAAAPAHSSEMVVHESVASTALKRAQVAAAVAAVAAAASTAPVPAPVAVTARAGAAAAAEAAARAGAEAEAAEAAAAAEEVELFKVQMGKLTSPLLERGPFPRAFCGEGQSILTFTGDCLLCLRSPGRVLEALRLLDEVVGSDSSVDRLLYASQQIFAVAQDLRMVLMTPATRGGPCPRLVGAVRRLLAGDSEFGSQLRSVLGEVLPYLDCFVAFEPLALVRPLARLTTKDPGQVVEALSCGIRRRVLPTLELALRLHEAMGTPELPRTLAFAAAVLGMSHGLKVSFTIIHKHALRPGRGESLCQCVIYEIV